ncbi:hypothetical protein LguiA_005432 [Lonicera macranthoides]
MHAKCGSIVGDKRVFDGMKYHDQVSWTSIVTEFSQNGHGKEAICLFKEMLGTKIRPNCFTYVSVINGCRELESSYVCDAYSKCGNIDEARRVFDRAIEKNSILWTSMIMGYA